MKYFMPQGEVATQAKAIIKARLAVSAKATKLMKRIGAEEFSYKPANFEVVGFTFKKPPDASKWRHMKKAGVWVPKASAKDIAAEMKALSHNTKDQIYRLLRFGFGKGGVKIICGPHGIRMMGLGWHLAKDGTPIFHTDDVNKLHGCKRISDLEAERMKKHAP